jgi:ethylene receptor
MMNGNLWSASEPEAGIGERETMTLVLRFQLQQFPSPHTPGSSTYRIPPQYNFNGLRILLADSDAVSLEVTRKLLERLGCQVVPVSSGLCYLSLLGSAGEPSFQLVILDLDAHGAGVNRFDVALRIRELSNSCAGCWSSPRWQGVATSAGGPE